jgi:hypothetical protein
LGIEPYICVPAPSAIASAPVEQQLPFIIALYELALSNDLPIIDFTYRFPSQAIARPAGNYFDDVHQRLWPGRYG